MTMTRIACTFESLEMLTRINMGGKAEVMFVKAVVLWILHGFKSLRNGRWGLESEK